MKRTPGPWIRLAHDTWRNPKIAMLRHWSRPRRTTPLELYFLALTWAGDNKQDGWLPVYALADLGATAKEADQLVDAGLWQADSGAGWWVHDWADWQDTSVQRQARTEQMRALANIRHHGHPGGQMDA